MKSKALMIEEIKDIDKKFFAFQDTLHIIVNENGKVLYAFEANEKEFEELAESVLTAVYKL